MGVLGQPFSQPLPAVNDPSWGTTLNAALIEIIARVSTLIDSPSIAVTTGDVKHGTRTMQLGAAAAQSGGATWTKGTGSTSSYWLGVLAGDTVEWTLPLCKNERLSAVRVSGRSTGVAWNARVWLQDHTTLSRTQLGTTLISGVTTSIEEIVIPTFSATTLAANQDIVVEWTAMAAGTRAIAIEFDADRQVAT